MFLVRQLLNPVDVSNVLKNYMNRSANLSDNIKIRRKHNRAYIFRPSVSEAL